MKSVTTQNEGLACSHGYSVVARDGPIGIVATPVFSGLSLDPDSLYVRTVDAIPGEFVDISANTVAEVDHEARRILVDGYRDELVTAPSTRATSRRQ